MKLLKVSIILLIYVTIIWGQCIEGLLHVQLETQLLILSIILFIIIFPVILKQIYTYEYVYLILTLLCLALSLLIWKDYRFWVVYSAVVFAFVINTTNKQLFLKLLLLTVIVQLIFSVYEFIFKEYIYVLSVFKYEREINLNEKLFAGNIGIFRAKGIFAGPLTASQFAIGVAFLFRGNNKVLLLTILIAILSNSRLGIILTILLFIISSVANPKNKNRNLIIGGGIVLYLLFNILNEVSIYRLSNALSIYEPSNHARLYYWASAFHHYMNYSDILKYLFGNSGSYSYIYSNNPENGWLALLVDNGLIGLLLHIVPLLTILIKSTSKIFIEVVVIISILIVNLLVTFHLGAMGGGALLAYSCRYLWSKQTAKIYKQE